MKISNIQLRIEGERVRLTADCSIRHFGTDVAYFMFDKKYKDFIVADASPFAAALLIPAMKLGQDLLIEGEISEQLYKGFHEVMKVMLSWNIGLKPISIFVDTLTKDSYKPTKNASFFSGGVDSFYTYLKNKKLGGRKIKYLILARGYDINLKDRALWEEVRGTVENTADAEQVEVIEVESNVRNLIEPIITWDYTHGGCLAALGLLLRKDMKNIFIASSSYGPLPPPWGSHPQLDHLWSTEALSFHNDGSDISRFEKVAFISTNASVLKSLRVCYINQRGKFNCCACEKCLRTMVSLFIAGVLEESQTFQRMVDIKQIKNLKIYDEDTAGYHRENLLELEKRNLDPALQDAIREALKNISSTKSYAMEVAKKIWFLDYYYNRGRLYTVAGFFRRKMLFGNRKSDSLVSPGFLKLIGIRRQKTSE